MTKIYHHLDQDIFTGLLRGQNRALLLRDLDGSEEERDVADRDWWLFNSCLELDLPSIDSNHPYAIEGYELFFGNERNMAEFTHGIGKHQAIGDEGYMWENPELMYYLGKYLDYPAGAIQYMLSHPSTPDSGEMIVRYGTKRFRVGMEQVVESCEQMWLLFPHEAKILYLEFASESDLEIEPKIYDVLAHDHNRLQRVVEDSIQIHRKQKKQKMFQAIWDIWRGT